MSTGWRKEWRVDTIGGGQDTMPLQHFLNRMTKEGFTVHQIDICANGGATVVICYREVPR